MSKRCLTQIGFVALIVFVSQIFPQPADAMRRATWGDYYENDSLRRHVNEIAGPIGTASTCYAYKREDIADMPRHIKISIPYANKLFPGSKWYVCSHEPNQHPFKHVYHGTRETSTAPTSCKNCTTPKPAAAQDESGWGDVFENTGRFLGGFYKGYQGSD